MPRSEEKITLEENWVNPNEPREGSRRSSRKRLFKEPEVIQHRLLLGPTLARRKSRKKRRKEQDKNASESGKNQSKKDEASVRLTRKGEFRRKLGPHGENLTLSREAALPDNVLNQQPPSPIANHASETSATRHKTPSSPSVSRKRQTSVGSAEHGKEQRKKSQESDERRPSDDARTIIDLTRSPTRTLAPAITPSASTFLSPGSSSLIPSSLLVHNPGAALVSPLGLCYDREIQSILSLNRRQMLEDSKTLQLLRRREHAVQLMQRSTDVSSIIASSRLVREYYAGTLMDASTQLLLEEAEGRGVLWLCKLLVRSFSKPILLGGLGFSPTKAKLIADEVVVNLADMIGKIDLSYETLVGIRILPHDALAISPMLRVIGATIRENSLAFRQEILMKSDTTCFGLSVIPTASYPSLPLGLATAYRF